jgi:hypothetical protein
MSTPPADITPLQPLRLSWRLFLCAAGGALAASLLIQPSWNGPVAMGWLVLLTMTILVPGVLFLGHRFAPLGRDDLIGIGLLCAFIGFEGVRRIYAFTLQVLYPGQC